MTKTIALLTLLVALLALPAAAQNRRVVVQDGSLTNQVYRFGTNTRVLLNRIPSFSSLFVGVNTNIAIALRGMQLSIPASTVSVGIGGIGTAPSVTNAVTYTFERSFDGVNWAAWTNLAVVPAGTNSVVWTNATFTLGDWHFVRVSNITNANASFWTSNRLEFYWRE
jgi:hypothetical protein